MRGGEEEGGWSQFVESEAKDGCESYVEETIKNSEELYKLLYDIVICVTSLYAFLGRIWQELYNIQFGTNYNNSFQC